MWKIPPSGRKCILTVYVIIELDSEAFRTSSPAGEPLTFISIWGNILEKGPYGLDNQNVCFGLILKFRSYGIQK